MANLSRLKYKVEHKPKYFNADALSGLPGNLFTLSIAPVVVVANHLHKLFPWPFYALTLDVKNNKSTEWIDVERYTKASEKILRYLKAHDFSIFEKLNRLAIKESEKLRVMSIELIAKLREMPDSELKNAYEKYMQVYLDFYGFGITTFLYEHILSERINERLMAKDERGVEFLHSQLQSNYKSFMTQSEESLLEIKHAKSGAQREKLIKKYLDRFYFADTSYEYSQVMTQKSIAARAKRTTHSKKTSGVKNKLKITLDKTEKNIIGLLRIAEVMRDVRKKINCIGNYTMFRFLDEAARRTGIPVRLAQQIFFFEFAELVNDPRAIRARLKKRTVVTAMYDGRNARFFEKNAIREKATGDFSTIKGTPASVGKLSGVAKIIWGSKDFSKLKKGEILITQMTRPNFLPVMKIAGAILTDEGGLTCHAAIVSRELGIPCIVGTRYATKAFKNGDIILVDAYKGTVIKVN